MLVITPRPDIRFSLMELITSSYHHELFPFVLKAGRQLPLVILPFIYFSRSGALVTIVEPEGIQYGSKILPKIICYIIFQVIPYIVVVVGIGRLIRLAVIRNFCVELL